MEKTFIMIKSDGVKRKLIGEIIGRIERKGFHITKLKMLTPTRELLEQHYVEHKEKPFFEELIEYLLNGSVLAMEVEGEDVVQAMRLIIGDKDFTLAMPGTIRGDFAYSLTENIIHGSDSTESANKELKLWFN